MFKAVCDPHYVVSRNSYILDAIVYANKYHKGDSQLWDMLYLTKMQQLCEQNGISTSFK